MGVRYSIEAGGLLYQVLDDRLDTYQAIFTGAVFDEADGSPIASVAVLSADLPGLTLRAIENALIVGSADVTNVFPNLATKAYGFNVSISAFGYRSITLPVTVPIASTFPLLMPPITLRRIPVRLQGRVVKASDRTAITTAAIASKNSSHLLLRDTLRSQHASGIAVNALSLTSFGAARSLTEKVARGADSLMLSSTFGIAVGDLMQIGGPVNAMVYQIAAVGPDPGLVALTQPVTASAPVATTVQTLTASAPTTTTTLARNSDAGDGVLTLVAGLTGPAIEIADGVRTEYHWINALSDANGYYSANGITGFKTFDLLCSAPTFTTFDQPWSPDYSQPVTILDFQLLP